MSSLKKVVITDYTFPSIDVEKEIISKELDANIFTYQCRNTEEVCEVSREADALLVQFAPITEDVIQKLNPGAIIVRYGVGYDNIDIKAANKHNVKVAYVPDYCINEVADHTVSLLLSILRKVNTLHQSIRNGYWQGVKISGDVKPFNRTYVGFIGFGRIGQAVMKRLKPFGFKFLINDPKMKVEQAKEFEAELVSRSELWKRADAFTLHVPATIETREVVNKQALSRMKKSAIVVNTARGELIDNKALAEALQIGEIAGAGLDVFETEPLLLDSIFLNTPNLIMTPHVAWFSNESIIRLQKLAAEEIVRGLKGKPLRCPIN